MTQAQLQGLTTLSANSNVITSLSGLQYATNLQTLTLMPDNWTAPGHLTDLSPLSGLLHLTTLALVDTGIGNSQLTTLESLSHLQSLDLRDNGIYQHLVGRRPVFPHLAGHLWRPGHQPHAAGGQARQRRRATDGPRRRADDPGAGHCARRPADRDLPDTCSTPSATSPTPALARRRRRRSIRVPATTGTSTRFWPGCCSRRG